jgi:excisionase family DNA binding protein
MQADSNWLTTEEAARYLKVNVGTLRRWAREGVIPAAKLGNRGGFRFRREDLDRFLESRRPGHGGR